MKELLAVHAKHLSSFVMGAITALGMMALLADDVHSQGQGYEAYKALLDEVPVLLDDGQAQFTKDVMARSLLAFLERDAEAGVAELAEGYSWTITCCRAT